MREFRAARRARTLVPIPFKVTYEVEVTKIDEQTGEPITEWEDRSEVFTCRGEISGLTLSAFAEASDIDVEEMQAEHVALIKQLFSEAFADETEYRRFARLARKHIDNDQLVDVIGGLIEDMAGRPTERPSGSSSESSRTGEPSRVAALPSMAATPVLVETVEEHPETRSA